MARALGWLYVAGATIGTVSLLLPRAPGTNVGALASNIALAYLGGVVVLVAFRRLPAWAYHIPLLTGTVLITRAVYYSGDGVSYYGVWYLWVALFAFSFFRRNVAILHVAAVGVAYALVLGARHESIAAGRWVTTVASLMIAGVFIDALVRRVRRQREHAAENAAQLAAVVEATQRIYEQPSAEMTRLDLCETALRVTSADSAVLWEPRGEDPLLVPVTAAGVHVGAGTLTLGHTLESAAGVARAFQSHEPDFTCGDKNARDNADLDGADRINSAFWQPVMRDREPVAVLALYWQARVPAPDENVCSTIVLLAAQAAIAIERADLLARLERIARTDELTGLPNRRAWREQLPSEMARAKREGWPLCVAVLDVDGLKRINDTLGHHAGDQLLKQNAAAWSSVLRPVDLLARYGGDEFAVMLTGCRLADAQQLIDRLVDATPSDRGFSVGLAEWDGEHDADVLVADADRCLYEAKAERSWLARPDTRPQALPIDSWDGELRLRPGNGLEQGGGSEPQVVRGAHEPGGLMFVKGPSDT
ncbi:MAG TPA: GGDEF domain-containing protein [Solirubrobacteraceae bacterium]|jgi:diguanylate cyclase (GGDEF)-like protein|nr:GGDEF domain-containing protein [Solirubrobacteraceae bacterium]